MFKKYLTRLFCSAVALNRRNINSLLEENHDAALLDLGCDDGVLSLEYAKSAGTRNVYGVEVVDAKIALAKANGLNVEKFDLNGRFNFADGFFDAIVSNQVIEHLPCSDNFLAEIRRCLKPGGYAIISTENASSWCNIFASVMGWQMFSLTNFSDKQESIGNPWSLFRGDKRSLAGTWKHVRIYNYRGLKEYFEAFGFRVEKIKGAGYFPLPSVFGDIDRVHCHFMAFKIRKA